AARQGQRDLARDRDEGGPALLDLRLRAAGVAADLAVDLDRTRRAFEPDVVVEAEAGPPSAGGRAGDRPGRRHDLLAIDVERALAGLRRHELLGFLVELWRGRGAATTGR